MFIYILIDPLFDDFSGLLIDSVVWGAVFAIFGQDAAFERKWIHCESFWTWFHYLFLFLDYDPRIGGMFSFTRKVEEACSKT